jgi:hypothetical protein
MEEFSFEVSIKFQFFKVIYLFSYWGQLESFSSLFIFIFSFP